MHNRNESSLSNMGRMLGGGREREIAVGKGEVDKHTNTHTHSLSHTHSPCVCEETNHLFRLCMGSGGDSKQSTNKSGLLVAVEMDKISADSRGQKASTATATATATKKKLWWLLR